MRHRLPWRADRPAQGDRCRLAARTGAVVRRQLWASPRYVSKRCRESLTRDMKKSLRMRLTLRCGQRPLPWRKQAGKSLRSPLDAGELGFARYALVARITSIA